MPESPSTTQFVKSSEEYKAPVRSFDRMRAITAKHQPVDHNGQDRPRNRPDPSVVETVTPGATPSMVTALAAAAEAVGTDLAPLLDSQAFVMAITPISPSDQAGLQDVILAHLPAPVAPRMAVNSAQGSGGATAPAPQSGNLLERLQRATGKAFDQPLPPGSTTV